MKKQIEEQLESLELQLADLDTTKFVLLCIAIVVGLLYISWSFFGENLWNEIEQKQSHIQTLTKKIDQNSKKSYLLAIAKLKKKSLKTEQEIDSLSYELRYMETKLHSLHIVEENKQKFAILLDTIFAKALEKNIQIESLQKKPLQPVQKIKEKTIYVADKITVDGKASFGDILRWVQSIESLKALMNTEELDIYLDENATTNFHLELDYYGAKL